MPDDIAQVFRVSLERGGAGEPDGQIGDKSFFDGHILLSGFRELHVLLGACNEENALLVQRMKKTEIHITAVHGNDAVRCNGQTGVFGGGHIVAAAIGDEDERGDAAAVVEQTVELYGSLRRAELGPWILGQTQ